MSVSRAPRVFVPSVQPPTVVLPEDEAHHLSRVLRAKAGDSIVIFDGGGREWEARIERVGKHDVTATLGAERQPIQGPALRMTLAIGLLKGDAMDAVVADATALGVAAIVPIETAHAVVPNRARGAEAVARWRRVAIAAAKQCGRATLPEIRRVTSMADAIAGESGPKLMCLEPALGGTELAGFAADSVLILIGPEGGWSREEVDAARAAGCHGVTIASFTLRAELAPSVAIAQVLGLIAAGRR